MPESRHRRFARRLARLRVPLGFVTGAIALWLARPTAPSVLVGAIVAACGEALRIWAAGHLEKGREVTRSGPYRWVRHPLYAGSLLMGIGFGIASWRAVVAVLVGVYLVTTLAAAVHMEERFLADRFGAEYEAYRAGHSRDQARPFSIRRAWSNREYRAVGGLAAVLLVLAWKLGLGR